MFFDAGIISNYMVVQSAGLMNSIWAIILPGAINVWYMIIMRTFFSDIPEELFESARLDGANDLTIFVKMVLPLSKAVLATMVLFYAVGFWNQWLQPLIYLNDRSRFPMQLILRNIVLGTDAALSKSMSASADMATMSLNIKYAVIFITILPILMVYPFVQKYFVKGVMVGSVKADYIERRIHNEKRTLEKSSGTFHGSHDGSRQPGNPGHNSESCFRGRSLGRNHDHDDDH